MKHSRKEIAQDIISKMPLHKEFTAQELADKTGVFHRRWGGLTTLQMMGFLRIARHLGTVKYRQRNNKPATYSTTQKSTHRVVVVCQ